MCIRDRSPCGGTHAVRTGEVGMIAVRTWERAKGLTRIEFVAGTRALADYRRANASARAIATLFSTSRDDAPQLAAAMVEDNKELQKRVRVLEDIAAGVEAENLLSENQSEGTRIIARVFDRRDAESLKKLAHALIGHPNIITLLGSRDRDTARLVFARSADASGDMSELMRQACEMIDGRGGGRPDMAQGGGKQIDKLDSAIAMVQDRLTNLSE